MGLRPLSAILNQIGVPDEVPITSPIGHVIDPNISLDNAIPGDDVTIPNINITPTHGGVHIPDIPIDTPEGNVTIPNTRLNETNHNKIIIPDTRLDELNSKLKVPNVRLDEINSKLIVPDIRLRTLSGKGVDVPNIILSTTKNKEFKIPDINTKSDLHGTTNPNIAILNSRKNLITIPEQILDSTNLNQITIPSLNIQRTTPDNDVVIPNITIPNSTGAVHIPTIQLNSSLPNDDVVIPNIAIPNSTGAVHIPNIIINNTIPNDDVVIPNINIPTSTGNVNIPNTLLNNFSINPLTIYDTDIPKTAYTVGYNSPFGWNKIGATSTTSQSSPSRGSRTYFPDVLSQPKPFIFRLNFDSKFSNETNYNESKLSKNLDFLYNQKEAIFRGIRGEDIRIQWPDFGSDRIGNGNSGQPYIRRRIGQTWAPLTNVVSDLSGDFLLRFNRGIEDANRISQWMLNDSNGILYTAKQIGLQLSNPKVESTRAQILPFIPTRIYNPSKLIAQIAGLPLGLHMPRHGILPEPVHNYEEVNKINNAYWNNFEIGGNRLLKLYSELSDESSIYLNPNSVKFNGGWVATPTILANKSMETLTKKVRDGIDDGARGLPNDYIYLANNFGLGKKRIKELSGLAGPKSIFGAGWTDIHSAARANFKIDWVNEFGAPTGVKSNYRPIEKGRYSEVLVELDNEYNSMIYLTIKDVSGPAGVRLDYIGSRTKIRTGGIGNNGIMNEEAGTDYNGVDYNRRSGYNYVSYVQTGSISNKITDNFGPGESRNMGVIGVTDGTIIPGAIEKYQDIRKRANGDIHEGVEGNSVGYNAHHFDYTSTDYQHNNVARKSYPLASRAGKGTLRRAINSTDEGENGLWPDMYARVGVPDTGKDSKGVSYFDTVLADVKPEYYNSWMGRDFVRVNFKRFDGGYTSFRGYISGLSDKWTPTWNGTKYVGRPDEVKVYQGVERSIGFSLMLVAESCTVMQKMYEKLNILATYTMPLFTAGGIMKGPLLFLTIGNLMYKLPGYISSLDLDFSDEYPWDIEIERPMYIKATIGYDVINENIPNAGLYPYPWYSYHNSSMMTAAANKLSTPGSSIRVNEI